MKRKTLVASVPLFIAGLALAAAWVVASDVPQADSQQRIDQLIRLLGDEDFFVREQAQESLAELGIEAFDALSVAETDRDPEIAARARYLLRSMKVPWTAETAVPMVKQALDGYEKLDETARRERIEFLGDMDEEAAAIALCHVVRFERSHVLSKWAAIQLIERSSWDADGWSGLSQVIYERIGASRRPAAAWLRTFAEAERAPAEALAAWRELVRAEETEWLESPRLSSGEIVLALLQSEFEWLTKRNRHDEAEAATRRMAEIEVDDPATLFRLVRWLTQREAWTAIDLAAERQAAKFEHDPLLAYALAVARRSKGDTEEADALIARALKLDPEDSARHLETAMSLQDEGLFDLADVEFRHVYEGASFDTFDEEVYEAYWRLSAMWYDQREFLRAADVLEEFIKRLMEFAKRRNLPADRMEDSQGVPRSRILYLQACHWAAEGDREKEAEALRAALERNPLDADVLIALYRLPDQPPEEREALLQTIRAAISHFREQMERDQENSDGFNQFAWLVSNTEGDQAEALRMSRRSLELSLGNAGHLDTLARCYYAQGDYANAVKYQELAVRREPHSGLMQRQLEQFRRAAADMGAAGQSAPASEEAL